MRDDAATQDDTAPACPSTSHLRGRLKELIEDRHKDPRGTRRQLHALIAMARASSDPEQSSCLGAALAIDAQLAVRLGEHEEGLELAREALRILEGGADSISEVHAANAHAEALMVLSRFEQARSFLHARIARAEARDKLHAGHVGLYGNLAALSFYEGSPASALQPLARALELATTLGCDQQRALVLGNFGNLYGQLGDHAKSLESHKRCAEVLREMDAPCDLANALHNVGVQLDRLGDPLAALEVFEQSLALRTTGDDPNKIAKTELDRAFSLVHLERFDEAGEAIERALKLNRRAGSRRQEARALTSLGNLEFERGRYREAIARFEESQELLEPVDALVADPSNGLGIIESYLALGEVETALELLSGFPEVPSDGSAGKRHVRQCDIWMRVLEAAGEPARALDFAKQRIAILELLHVSDADRTILNMQGIHQIELMRQRERDQVRVRAELEALVAERARELLETNAELEARVDELVRAEYARSMLEEELRQAQKMDAIGRLAGGVAHDFNNLLTVILGRGELLLDEIGREHPGHDSLREMMEAASRASRLTIQLLAFGRKQALRPTELNLEDILAGLQRLLSRLLGERINVSVSHERDVEGGGRPLTVLADRGQLEQVFVNLAINARDAMPSGGKLSFHTSRVRLAPTPFESHGRLAPGSYACIRVSDTGEGMTPEVMERIFEPFFTTKELDKGTGLGLSTAHGIIHQSGGTITVESVPGGGSTFEVLLPIARAEQPSEPQEEPAESAMLAKKTVLVVEDDAGLRRVMHEGLSRRGYEILDAADGTQALALSRAYSVDLVICDRVLPRLSGLEVLTNLRERFPELPILVISGHPQDEGDEVTIEGTRFLAKPFKLEDLARILQEMLQ